MSREMKDSGVEWIGEIPKLWEVKKLGSLYKKRNEKVSDIDYQPLSVTKNGILPQLETAAKSNNHENRKLVLKDDFVINSRADRKMSSGTSSYDGSVSLINHVLYSEIMNPQYTNYLLKNYSFAEEFYRWGSGIVDDLWSTNWDKMKKINIPIPSRAEQIKIAQEIDAKISVISNILTETRESIENLKKYKQSLITEVVTKGLDKNVEMKDSGIEWIGEIPKDWSIVKINKVAKIKNGKEVSTETGVIPVYGSGGIFKYTDDFLYEGESVLFGRKGTIGKPIYTNSKIWTVDTMFYTEIKNTIIAKLFYYFLTAFPWSIYETKTALPSIVGGEIEQSKILLPNKKTQQEIVNYLDEKTEAIDNIVESKYILIREYESYKKSLIYEYVTGKKEVGEEVE
ncbi:restriction endonuclease subunit S [Macrococcoides caseolyticum]|uniref:restriction endonuclease subunit S n=1 Tax=Macrococcoides caseolyticum TaxID=69966 RepID=UPI003F5FF034